MVYVALLRFFNLITMSSIESYLVKNNFKPSIETKPSNDLGIIVVIPCFNESNLIETLNSLWNCIRPNCNVEIITVINHPENCLPEIITVNENTLKETIKWINLHNDDKLNFHCIYVPGLPQKHAGVGLARKIGMDEASYRLNLLEKKDGIIAGFDADSLCEANYLVEIEKHFKTESKTSGASIYFEHPINDPLYSPEINEGIINYELHLRYLNQALRYTGHPHAFHTIGSSFAVRVNAYVKQGGMNKRQAGEDFYFIQKIIALGNYSEINTTRVIPSPRESDRVPFGTGAAIKKWINSGDKQYTTYNFESFQAVKSFLEQIPLLCRAEKNDIQLIISKLPLILTLYLESNDYLNEIKQIQENTNSLTSFENRFYAWFNIFKIIRFLNESHKNHYNMTEIMEAAKILIKMKYPDITITEDKILILKMLREIEKKGDSHVNHSQ